MRSRRAPGRRCASWWRRRCGKGALPSRPVASGTRRTGSCRLWPATSPTFFEEASRALFAQDYERLRSLIALWPEDVRDHLQRLIDRVMAAEAKAAQAAADGKRGGPN